MFSAGYMLLFLYTENYLNNIPVHHVLPVPYPIVYGASLLFVFSVTMQNWIVWLELAIFKKKCHHMLLRDRHGEHPW